MIRLPALTAEQTHWRLPLSAPAAGVLLQCLLTDDVKQAESQIAELLSGAPPLTLWCLCRSPRWRIAPPQGFQEVAHWLAGNGPQVLRWEDDRSAELAPCEPAQLEHWAALASQSIIASRLAAEAGNERQLPLAVLGALHNAAAWLASVGPAVDVSGGAQPVSCLPGWLVEWLRELAAPSPGQPRSATLVQAIGAARDAISGGLRGDAVAEGTRAAVGEIIARVQQQWRSSQAGLGSILAGATRKLARLHELEQHFDRAVETEKLAALKGFAYGASHEINNPLANISTRAQTLLREETDPERRRKLAVINSQAFRAHELIADLMLFARPPALSLAPVDLVYVADQVVAELAAEAAAQRTTLVRLPQASPVVVSADGGHLAAVLRAVCVNSLEALRLGGRIEVSVRPCTDAGEDSDGGPWAEIAVADTGPGIAPETRRHLFDPYFSGREAGRGIGLGLSKSWRIVTEHGGRIEVESQLQQGATFRIRLPAR